MWDTRHGWELPCCISRKTSADAASSRRANVACPFANWSVFVWEQPSSTSTPLGRVTTTAYYLLVSVNDKLLILKIAANPVKRTRK